MTVCPQCHTVHGDEHSFCQRCGNPLVGEEKANAQSCPNCSGLVFPGQNFCTECGQRLKFSSAERPGPRLAPREELFYTSAPRRTRPRPEAPRSGLPKWLIGLAVLALLGGVYFLWPSGPERNPLTSGPGVPAWTMPSTDRADTLQRDVERRAVRIRASTGPSGSRGSVPDPRSTRSG